MNKIKKETGLINYLPALYQQQAKEGYNPVSALLLIFEHSFSEFEKTIDIVDTYFDPYLTTGEQDKSGRDFLSWLASWVNLGLDELWSERKKRYLIRNAAILFRYRGALIGLKYIIEQFFDINVEIKEWDWPQGMEIGKYSSVGIDTVLMEQLDTKLCFMVIWKPPHADVKPELLKKIRTVIDLEKPAHTRCYFQLKFPEEKMPEIEPMVIGLNSTIGLCYINQEVKNERRV